MKIACLGWGSLIWRPENLSIQREWYSDGPILPIEFARKSKDGRLTLVITEGVKPVRTLWALMATPDLNIAKTSLQIREGISDKNIDSSIGTILANEQLGSENSTRQTIRTWMASIAIDAVIWTNLPPKFNKDGVSPSLNEAVTYLVNLDINTRTYAEEYIRRAPRQIDTDFRREFEKRWGWTYLL